MCGIFCLLTNTPNKTDLEAILKQNNNILQNIVRRGPDSFNHTLYSSTNFNLFCAASVLWLQGQEITAQPLENAKSLFLYNGDIFGGSVSEPERMILGDTTMFLEKLEEDIFLTLSTIQGPYAFIYMNKAMSKLYFGRDIYGRRSLLIGKDNDNFIITSVATRNSEYNFIELPSIGTFCWDLINNELQVHPWQYRNRNFDSKLQHLNTFLGLNIKMYQQLVHIENNPFKDPVESDLTIFKNLTLNNFGALINDNNWLIMVETLHELLRNAIKTRISTQPQFCKNCILEKNKCNHATVGVLFSGGIDCSILALLSDDFVDKERPIDLINVAFNEEKNYEAPDRETGLSTLEELKKLRPERRWNFLSVNVTNNELNGLRKTHIADLIYPLNTVLDDSLGCALWFAGRGQATCYTSPCRVLLVGMGADELFGGYTRHKAALKKEGWKGLHEVLNTDWENLSHRNLARDDRVISDHGRQLRTPFLDENFVAYTRSLQPWQKTYPSHEVPQGVGEKILLRSLAYYLGLKNAALFKKRALQFGSRIANSKENANDISTRLTDS